MIKSGGTKDDVTIHEMLLDANQYKKELAEVAKHIRQQNKLEKDAALVHEKVAKDTEALEKNTRELASSTKRLEQNTSKLSQAMSVAGGMLITKGIAAMNTAMRGAVSVGLDWEDWIGRNAQALRGMQNAVSNIIPPLDLAKARSRLLAIDGLAMTERQLNAVAKAAVEHARINKTEFGPALQRVTDTIQKGTSRGLKELGINFDLVGTAADKSRAAVDLIAEKFGDMNIQVANTNESISAAAAAWQEFSGAIGSAILQSDYVRNALDNIAWGMREFTRSAQQSQTPIGKLNRELDNTNKSIAMLEDTISSASGGWPVQAIRWKSDIAILKERRTAIIEQIDAMKSMDSHLFATHDGPTRSSIDPSWVAPKSGKGKKKSSKDPYGDDWKDPFATGGATVAEIAAQEWEKYEMGKAIAELTEQREARIHRAQIDRIEEMVNASRAQFQALDNNRHMMKMAADAGNMLGDSAKNVAAGMLASTGAMIAGGASAGQVARQLLAAEASRISQIAAMKAIEQAALGLSQWMNPYGASKHFAAAAMFGTLAVGAGFAGAKLSAGSGAGSTMMTAPMQSSAPTFGRETRRDEKQEVHVNVYIGDSRNKSAAVLATRQASAQMARA